ncbi:NAD-dependent epimerase [Marivirga sp. S37H4]|uniref:NAD-dependent epimerase n=1 Tax=Marivirga aurantiaca TaxID=2802615 RepID=A0A935C9X9_9BACT|nr:NAD-dependent epimerase [Marivirga aurantiaca]MBK6264508.1 NAD-dependent epimerase [Marivirga aurantiaca]
MSKKILVTGAAGFIGFHLSKSLLERGDQVVGYDCISDYYDVNLKYGRLNELGIKPDSFTDHQLIQSKRYESFRFVKADLCDKDFMNHLFKTEKFDHVINLAAQAGVRYSVENPQAYLDANVQGFLNILEACRHYPVKHLVYASSSSVYGSNGKMPFSVNDNVDHPLSLYAATKKSNELMAHTYSHLFDIPTTGIRFFTVYGAWGRPDMALFLFADAITKGKPLKVFNHGNMERDFTYVGDIVKGVMAALDKPAQANPAYNAALPEAGTSTAPYKIYNIGNNQPVKLMAYIEALEKAMGKTAEKEMLPMQQGDVQKTYADVSELIRDFDYAPNTALEQGIQEFVNWYKQYYGIE